MKSQRLTTSGSSGEGGPRETADEASEASREGASEHSAADQLAALRHQIAMRDEFISTVAHELRNPISPVYLQIEHLKETVRASDGPIAPSWLLTQLEGITGRFDRFLESLNRLLDATRVGAGHLVLALEDCDLV